MAAPVFSLSPYALLAWKDGEACVRSLLDTRGVASDDAALLLVLHAFAIPRTIDEAAAALGMLDAADVRGVVEELAEIGVLVSSPSTCFWEPADLAFHQASTSPGDVKIPGPSAVPAVRPAFEGAPRTALVRSPPPAPGSLGELLERRCSTRAFGAGQIPLSRFSTLLERSAANRGPAVMGTIRRAYPSGGALHSLELYPVVPAGAVEGVPSGLYHYAAADHALELLSTDDAPCAAWIASANAMMGRAPSEGAAPIVLLVTSRFGRVAAGYREIAYRLVLMELGCLFQTLYVVAEDLGLGACALGGIAYADRLAALGGFDPLIEPLVGEMVVGALASA